MRAKRSPINMGAKMEVKQTFKERCYYPNNGWNPSQPEAQGVDSANISKIEQYLHENFPSYRSFMMIKNGYLVYECRNKRTYEKNSSLIFRNVLFQTLRFLKKSNETLIDEHGECYNLRSATKSIMSILLGIALDKQYINSIDEKVYKFLPSYNFQNDKLKKEITIEHLITMKSGLASIEKGIKTFKLLFSDGDWINAILNLPMETRPGRSFIYNSANTHLLSAVLSNATKMSTYDFADHFLFQPLGIKNVYWEKDKKGYNFGGGNLFMKPHDMAKIGYLFLNNGILDGKEIVSKSWIEESLKGRFEWEYGYHYGYLWYIRKEKAENQSKEYITYSASGAGGQKIWVIPELDIVMVATSRTNFTGDKSYFLENIISNFILPLVK
jgi:CubicO group peptidase (beta-lactamase class C family)